MIRAAIVYSYEDLSDIAHGREDRRNHLVSRVRGWLRKDRAPQLTIVWLLLPTAAWVVAADGALRWGGLDLPPLRWALAIFAAWPVFVLLLRWRAATEWQALRLQRLSLAHERFDEDAEAIHCAPKSARWLQIEEGVRRGVNQNMGRLGAAGLPAMLLLGALTLGCWTIWKLVRSGPTLLTGVLVDGEVVPSTPSLVTRVSCEHWFTSALGETYPFFLSLAFAAFVLGLALPFFFPLWIHAH